VCDVVLHTIDLLTFQYAPQMRLSFIDESARDDQYYFFGALIADDDAVQSIDAGLDGVASLLAGQLPEFDPSTEFHAVDMFHGKNGWVNVPLAWRVKACTIVAKVLARSSAEFVFRGIDVHALRNDPSRDGRPPHLVALAEVLGAVDERLRGSDQHGRLGLVLADEHHSAASARRSLRTSKTSGTHGTTERPLQSIADPIYFGPSHESRLLQAADWRPSSSTERSPCLNAIPDRRQRWR
jgi:hypothetical protein